MRLQGKTAIVTGAASGIGRAVALCFAREGASVVVDYVDKADAANELVKEIEAFGGKATKISVDVSEAEQVETMVGCAVKQFGGLDILVNNAGIEKETPFWDVSHKLWSRILAVNLSGPFFCAQAAARQMIRQGRGGRIINISSVHEDMPMPTNLPYCVTKGGLRMMMRTAAVELAPYKVTVNNIGPGAIDTPLDKATKDDPKKYKALLAGIPLARMGLPEEVAELAAFLASASAAYVTGSTYFIDGGMLRQSGSL